MMNERIIFGDPIEPEPPTETLPDETLLTGMVNEQRQAPFQVYIVGDVYQEIWAHIEQTPTIESGGVLVGHPFKDAARQITFVIVTGAIPQHSDDRSVGHFTVRPTEIAAARLEMEDKYPGLIVVGWYHSHPGHGIFLSGQDMTIVRSIYNASWHIAMVIDPRRHTEGIFVGPEGIQLSGEGHDDLHSSWLELRHAPHSLQAIAYYNQAQEALAERRLQEAHQALDQLQTLVESSEQLIHWRETGYREISDLRARLEEEPDSEEEMATPYSSRPDYQPPQPARTFAGLGSQWRPLLSLSIFAAALLVLFFFVVTAFRPQRMNDPLTLGFGILLSILAVVMAGYVLGIKAASTSEVAGGNRWLNHPLLKPLGASLSVGLVLLSWCGLSLNIYSANLVLGPVSAPTTPSPTMTIAPLLVATPTFTPTSMATVIPPTETPTPLPPMATSTLTPTMTVMPTIILTPTATLAPADPLTPTAPLTVTSTITPAIGSLEESDLSTQTEAITTTSAVSTTTETQ